MPIIARARAGLLLAAAEIVAGTGLADQLGTIDRYFDGVITGFGHIRRPVGNHVLTMDLLADTLDSLFETFLAHEGELMSARRARKLGGGIAHEDAFGLSIDLFQQGL